MNKSEEEKCPDCLGSGKCSPCGGEGDYPCSWCGGDGTDSNGDPCLGCPSSSGRVECTNCHGNSVCPDCNGTGIESKERNLKIGFKGVVLISSIGAYTHVYRNTNDYPVLVTFYWYNKYYDWMLHRWIVKDGDIEKKFKKHETKQVTFPINQFTKIIDVVEQKD